MQVSMRELRELLSQREPDAPDAIWTVGKAYFIRTVTYHLTGRLVKVGPTELVIEDAAWVADSGRFMDAIKHGNLHEVEPISGPVIVGRGSITDACQWPHALPQEQI